MESEQRRLVSFYELSEEWQKEAVSNNDERAEEETYIEPIEDQNPFEHALQDLSECMRVHDELYDGVIGISNTMAIGVKFIDSETVTLTYL